MTKKGIWLAIIFSGIILIVIFAIAYKYRQNENTYTSNIRMESYIINKEGLNSVFFMSSTSPDVGNMRIFTDKIFYFEDGKTDLLEYHDFSDVPYNVYKEFIISENYQKEIERLSKKYKYYFYNPNKEVYLESLIESLKREKQ